MGTDIITTTNQKMTTEEALGEGPEVVKACRDFYDALKKLNAQSIDDPITAGAKGDVAAAAEVVIDVLGKFGKPTDPAHYQKTCESALGQ